MPRLVQPLDAGVSHPAGYAMLGDIPHPRAYASYDAAQQAADGTLRPLYVVLGCIFVHETSHLLGLHHQPRGVMRANLRTNDMDNTTSGRAFTAEEQKQLRAAIP